MDSTPPPLIISKIAKIGVWVSLGLCTKFGSFTRVSRLPAAIWLLALAAIVSGFSPAAHAEPPGPPFNCDVVFYQMRNTGGNSQLVKFASVGATITPTAVFTAVKGTTLNSIGYNPVDNFIYGIISSGTTPLLYRVGQTGYELVGTINNGLPGGFSVATFTPTAGVFDAAGRYYFAGQGGGNLAPAAIFRIDSIPIFGAPQISHQYNLSPGTIANFGDFDFNGAGGTNGLLLGTAQTNHYRITLAPSGTNPAQGTAFAVVTPLGGGGDVGGVGSAFYDAFTGQFYVFNNTNNDFWRIDNPQIGTPQAVLTQAASYVGPPAFPGPYTPTDGTSCPISGTRRADLSITKTDNVVSLPTQSVTSYVITVVNGGPYPANYSVVSDPAAAGLTKLSVTCSAPGGPPSAVCPATLTTNTFQTGVQIVTFPPQSTLVFTVNALVTGAPGTTVTNTAVVTPASDTQDLFPANNTAIDVDTVSATTSSVVSAASICPAGTTENLTNLVVNSDFSAPTPFSSEATVGAVNTYAAANFVSRQTGTQQYLPGGPIFQNAFAGDAARSVGGSPNWLLSNGKTGAANYRVWTQPLAGLTVGRTYEFMTYVSNATRPGTASPTVPNFTLQVFGTATTTVATLSPANETVGVGDRWTLVQGTFTASVAAVTLSISNFAAVSAEPGGGDVAGVAQATLRSCDPAADVAVSKTNGVNSLTTPGTTAYTITVANLTAGVNATNTLIVDPAASSLIKTTITCVATAGSQCPAALGVLALEGSGLTIPLILSNGTVTFRVFADVTGTAGQTATNIVTISGVNYTDSNPANNQAQDSDPVRGIANLSITKTNVVTTLSAGGTTSYTVTVANAAGSAPVDGAVLTDPLAQGLQCTSVTCVGVIGAATCPAPAATTIALLQGSGIVLPLLSPNSALIFKIDCSVTATGV